MCSRDSVSEVVVPEFQCLSKGHAGAEGPVFTPDGRFFMVAPEVELDGKPAGKILQINEQDEQYQVSEFCSPCIDGDGGIPAGLQSDRQGNLWVADMRLGLLKVTPQGELTQVSRLDSSGDNMQGCNDLTFDYGGNLWITAPAGDIAPHPYTRSMEVGFGSVYCLVPRGEFTNKPSVPVKVATGLRFPNGIAVRHDVQGLPKTLIVAETPTKTLWAFDIHLGSIPRLDNKREWAKLTGEKEGGPDGMDFDEHGNLLVANWGHGCLQVFNTAGVITHEITLPFHKVSNLHFRPGSNEVFVTEHCDHAIWKFDWKYKGRVEYCDTL